MRGVEELLADDFLDFVSTKFPELNPYDRLDLCKSNIYLLSRRCQKLMEDSSLGPVNYHKGWHHYISLDDGAAKQISLFPKKQSDDRWTIQLALHPGDTINQARYLYSNISLDRLNSLSSSGWQIRPNFHFAFRSSNLVWTDVTCTINNYVEFWKNKTEAKELGQIKREDWPNYFSMLSNSGMFSEQDKNQIVEKIENTRMDRINICPGLQFVFEWSQELSTELDTKKAFLEEFVVKTKECLNVWNT